MTTDDRTMDGFRRRLHHFIEGRFEGRYTHLAQQAGIPVSSLQHCLHHATRFPGGDHLLRLADVLGVSVDYLLTGREQGPAGSPAAGGPLGNGDWPTSVD